MHRFSTRSTEKSQRLRLLYLCAALWSLAGLSCVSQPKPAAQDASQTASGAAAPVVAAPEVVGLSRPAIAVQPARAALAEPEPRLPAPAAPPGRPPVDITVLSTSPSITFAPVRLPEPVAPVAAARPTTTAPAVPPKTAPTTAPTAPVAAPKATPTPTPTPSKPATPPATKPESSTAAATTPAPATTPQSGQAVVLPAAPTSSARVEAAARPVAETKIETARGERFELRFPGSGWIYLGDEQGKEGLRYETRRFEDNAAVFAMSPDQVGEYLLRFQRQNPVDRSTEVSLVRVTVVDKPAPSATQFSAASAPNASSGQVTTPTSTQAQPAAQSATQQAAQSSAQSSAPSSGLQPSAQAPGSQPGVSPTPQAGSSVVDLQTMTDPSELLKRARDELDAKRVQNAIDALDRYLSLYPYGSDDVYYLYGLAYEQDTPFRNIKKSYDAYRRVRDEYPRSTRWKDAADRMAYFEKHYLGLR